MKIIKRILDIILWVALLPFIITYLWIALVWDIIFLPVNLAMKLDWWKTHFFLLTKTLLNKK